MFDREDAASRAGPTMSTSYAVTMAPVNAQAVLAALRARSPGLGVKKAHKLLYYCQGHHLAAFGHPLFPERISAWDMGPVVGQAWYAEKNGDTPDELPELDEAALNTVGYVISRYGGLSGTDLERLTHHEPPWADADLHRAPGTSVAITQDAIRAFFLETQIADDDEAPASDSEAVASLVDRADERRAEPSVPDDPDVLRGRIETLRRARRAG